MIDHIQRIRDEAEGKISSAPNSDELDRLRVHYLGKKGLVTSLLHQLRDLSPEKRREMGAALNRIKNEFEDALSSRSDQLEHEKIQKELEGSKPIDLTLPGTMVSGVGSFHPINKIIEEASECLKRIGFSIAQGPEIEHEFYNFEALNTPQDHPARDMQDTFYVNGPILLRSHTSSVQIRAMKKKKPPLQIITYGKVYRSDYDQTHTPMFHQLEGLMVDKVISFADLKGVLYYLIKNTFGARPLRFRPSYFPFTEPSAEIDMQWKRRLPNGKTENTWMEIGGCGMVHPNVLKAVNIDPETHTGFAFGMGIERIAMLKYGIDDLRSFFENDQRMLEQF